MVGRSTIRHPRLWAGQQRGLFATDRNWPLLEKDVRVVWVCVGRLQNHHTHTPQPFFFSTVCVYKAQLYMHQECHFIFVFFFFLRPELIDLNEDISMLTIRRENVSLLLPMCSLSKKQMSTWKRRKSSCGAPFFFKRFGASISISSQAYRGQWLHVLEFFDGRKREKKK